MFKKTIIGITIFISCLVLSFTFYMVYINYLKPKPVKINSQLSKYLKEDDLKKPTFLAIFSPECGPCQILIKNIYDNRDSLSKVNLLLASTRDSISTNNFFLSISNSWQEGMKHPVKIYDARNKIGSYFVEIGLPKVYIFDRNGKLDYVKNGALNLDSIKLMLKKYD